MYYKTKYGQVIFTSLISLFAISCSLESANVPNVNKANVNSMSFKATKAYTSWVVGDPNNVNTPATGGTVLMGGGTDVDEAMKWMLTKAAGGDVVVIRDGSDQPPYEGADAYNSYFYSELGVKVNSVETIYLNSKEIASNPEVVQKVKDAECLFFTGGDQSFYYNYIEGTPLEDAVNYLKNVKKVPVGGTSAGCAVQSNIFFSAENGTITSEEALANPYNPKITLRKDNFFNTPFLANTIADTHYNNPDRRGREITFMARIEKDWGISPRGIGIDEKTAVCIEPNGIAKVIGSGYAFFLQQNGNANTPDKCLAGSSLSWVRDKKPIKTYKIEATKEGTNYFDLNTWSGGSGGSWQYYYADRGNVGISY